MKTFRCIELSLFFIYYNFKRTMKINEILNKFSGINLAESHESEALCAFIKRSPMQGRGLNLAYERSPTFFHFLNYQGDEKFVIVAKNSTGSILLVASITTREGYVKGKKTRIAYLSDLRVDSSKITTKFFYQWKTCMGELIKNMHLIEKICADYIITAIMADNIGAKRSLVNRSKNSFEYLKLSNYKMINIFKKFKVTRSSQYEVSWCEGNNNEVLDFLEKQEKKKDFGYTREFIVSAVNKWQGVTASKLLVVRKRGEIMAVTFLWNPSPVKKIIIKSLPRSLKKLHFLLSLFMKTPTENEEFKIEYLNFLNIVKGHESCFNDIINFVFKSGHMDEYHSLAFGDFETTSLEGYIKASIKVVTELELYQVIDKSIGGELVQIEQRPGFEISLV